MIVNSKLSREDQCKQNILQWLKHIAKIIEPPLFMLVKSDRAYFEITENLVAKIYELEDNGVLEEREAGHHGQTVVKGWRETVSRYAVQIVLHTDRIEVDFDLWQPRDAVTFVGHAGEVIGNYLLRRTTDPYRVARGLRKRGIYADDLPV